MLIKAEINKTLNYLSLKYYLFHAKLPVIKGTNRTDSTVVA